MSSLSSGVATSNHPSSDGHLRIPSSDDDVVIVSALRTPQCRGRKGGGLYGVPPATLLQRVLEATLQQSGVSGQDVEDVCVGNVLLPPAGYASLRMAQIAAGIPESTSFQMVNRQCSSGLQAVAHIANAIRAGEITIGIGAGVESMSLTPMDKLEPVPTDWSECQKYPAAMDCLLPMGITSDTVVKEYGLERHVMDRFALASHQKAATAQQNGNFQAEIVPVVLTDGTTRTVTADDGIRPETSLDALSKLKPAFTPTGASTAGNSSQVSDGAAAILLMTRREARERGLPIRATWRNYCTAGVPPRIMGIGPAVAIPKVLQQARLQLTDIDVYEINEAFASQAVWCIEELGLQEAVVNPNGGAIALGHPLGCTGARMIATLIAELQRRNGRFGIVSMCIGTGMGAAAVIEAECRS